jgi:hypothetical protein
MENPMSLFDEHRAAVAELRQPPLADPPRQVEYFVRSGDRIAEIGTSEDWWILQQYFDQPEMDRMEIWASDELASASIRLWPFDDDPFVQECQRVMLDWNFLMSAPQSNADDPFWGEPFAPGYHPHEYTNRRAAEDGQRRFEEAYLKRMGRLPSPPGVDGPVTHQDAA